MIQYESHCFFHCSFSFGKKSPSFGQEKPHFVLTCLPLFSGNDTFISSNEKTYTSVKTKIILFQIHLSMNKLRNLSVFLSVFSLLSVYSCSTYQIEQMSSAQRNETGNLISESPFGCSHTVSSSNNGVRISVSLGANHHMFYSFCHRCGRYINGRQPQ